MRTDKHDEWENRNESKDAARLGTLMGKIDQQGDPSTRSSIPMPPLDRGEDHAWDARGAMTLESYQRLRRGYERGINPEALERMEEHRESGRHARSYGESSQPEWDAYAGNEQEPERSVQRGKSGRSRRMGPIAVMLVLLVGIIGALLLYAGGVEYITALFGGGTPVSDENLTLVTERPRTEPEIDPSGALTPGEEMELAEAEGIVDGDEKNPGTEESEIESRDEPAATSAVNSAAEKREEERRAKAEKDKADQARRELAATAKETTPNASEPPKKTPEKASAKPATTAPVVTAQSTPPATASTQKTTPKVTAAVPQTSGAKRFAVQVRATPNKEEADRIAKSLRAKGGADVHIIAAEKNGETVYRVRFGSFGSEEEGKTKASEMGFGNVWVVKQ